MSSELIDITPLILPDEEELFICYGDDYWKN